MFVETREPIVFLRARKTGMLARHPSPVVAPIEDPYYVRLAVRDAIFSGEFHHVH